MKSVIPLLLFLSFSASLHAQTGQPGAHSAHEAIYLKFTDLKWQKIMPELGERSPEIVILHVDPATKATKLMIRVPKNFHVPKHWHSANETHTVISGTFIMEHVAGQGHELGPGSFNYVPSKTVHEAWTKVDEGTLLFITVDGPWDVNWVEDPPKPN